MKDGSEITILKEGAVKITNLRAIIGTKTYAISNVTSVNMRIIEPKMFLPVLFMVNMGICSVLIASSNMEEYARYLQTGLYLAITGILLMLISSKTKYRVHIIIETGELRILDANDREYVERIVKAMNDAIALREQLPKNDIVYG
jgi:hypothetical protein